MIILKVGGSVITRKEAEKPTLNHETLLRISEEIADSSYHKLIVVHGAGSYGHALAKEYGIGNSIKNTQELTKKKMGFSIIQHSMKELNSVVCEYLRTQGVFSVSIQPSSFILTKNKRIYSANLDLICKYLDLGFVPVLCGDVVLDMNESVKMAVLSGDQIIKYLAENLKPKRVILGSDVDGIYDKDPKRYSDARLLREVTSMEHLENQDNVHNHGQSRKEPQITDVTGGMRGKLTELLELAEIGVESEIVNANHDNIIKKAINGDKITGTLIKKRNKKVT